MVGEILLTDWDDITNIISDPALPTQGGEDRLRAYLVIQVGANVGELFPIRRETMVIGRSKRADIQLLEDGVSRQHARITVQGDEFFVEDLNSRNGTFINTEKITGKQRLESGDKLALAAGKVVLRFTFGDSLDESFQRQMFDSSLRDGLTMAFNKRYFGERLESEIKFAKRHEEPLALLLLDLDNFKAVNDQHGHVAGDRVLRRFAETMMKSVRNEDVFARYGGEEFAVITRAISLEGAKRFAERLRAATERLEIEANGTRIPITVSVGIALLGEPPADGPTGLIAAADRALYRAKENGRNQVQVYDNEREDTKPL